MFWPTGRAWEVGVCGREGCTAWQIAVGFNTSDTRAIVQIAGTAFRLSVASLVKALRRCPVLERRIQQHGQTMALQAAQVAACNRLHDVDERLARWLLMSQDRMGGDEVVLTHEFLGQMLGTRRSSVTVAAGLLSKAGLITYNRGHVTIDDRTKLEDAACECYELIRRHTDVWNKQSA